MTRPTAEIAEELRNRIHGAPKDVVVRILTEALDRERETRVVSEEPTLNSLTIKDGVADFRIGNAEHVARNLLAAFADQLAAAENYVEISFRDPDSVEQYTVTIQKHRGKTPAQIINELRDALKHNARAEKRGRVAGLQYAVDYCDCTAAMNKDGLLKQVTEDLLSKLNEEQKKLDDVFNGTVDSQTLATWPIVKAPRAEIQWPTTEEVINGYVEWYQNKADGEHTWAAACRWLKQRVLEKAE